MRMHWARSALRRTLLHLLIYWTGSTAASLPLVANEKPPSDTKPGSVFGILVDVSPHQRKVIDFEREAVHSILGRLEDVAAAGFIMKYDDEVKLLQDQSPLEDGFDNVLAQIELNTEKGKGERTLLYDALYAGMAELESKGGSDSKVLIIIGEGNDDGSTTRYSQIKKLARSAHVQCFALLVADHNLMGGRVRHFGFYLYDLAGATKGRNVKVKGTRCDNANGTHPD